MGSASSREADAFPAMDRAETSTSPIHLFVLAHGIDGTTEDLCNIRKEIQSLAAASDLPVQCWNTNVNKNSKTHAGVHECARRIWDQLVVKLETLAPSSKVSFIGHSLGGLMLRHVAAKLHASRASRAPHAHRLPCLRSRPCSRLSAPTGACCRTPLTLAADRVAAMPFSSLGMHQ